MTPEQWHRTWVAPGEARRAIAAENRAQRLAAKAERKAKWEADMAYWAATKEERAAVKREKARVRAAEKNKLNPPEVRRAYEKNYREKRKDCPVWKAKREAIRRRFNEKQKSLNAPAIAARKSERDAKKAMELAGKEERRLAREAAAAERKRVLALNPKVKRVRLTDEDRKDARRAEKRNYKHRRRCRIREQEAKATPSQIRELKKSAKGRCFYCRAKVKMLTLDHIVPIAKGGGHTLDNIVFACHACNSEKRDLHPNEYAHKHGLLLV